MSLVKNCAVKEQKNGVVDVRRKGAKSFVCIWESSRHVYGKVMLVGVILLNGSLVIEGRKLLSNDFE